MFETNNPLQQSLWVLFGGLGSAIPLILVWLAGLVFAVLYWRKAPRASLLTMIAILLFFLNLILSNLSRLFPLWSEMRGESIASFYLVMSFVSSLVSAIGFGLLLAAVFWSGGQTKSV